MSNTWPVIGHDWAVTHLSRAIAHGRTRHAYLVTGPDQVGKATLARAFAQAVNCTGELPPCGGCRTCRLIMQDLHPDVSIVEAEREGGTLKIEQIRALQRTLALRPFEAHYRVAILRRFHEARPQAADALLKTLEEPPSHALLILTTSATDALLPTILSRCQPLHLRPLPINTVRQALEQHWQAAPDTAHTLAALSGGRIGWAVRALENPEALEQRNAALDLLEQSLLGQRQQRFDQAQALARDKTEALQTLALWVSYWRDVMLFACGSQAVVTNVDRLDGLQDLARIVGIDAAQQALAATRRTITHLHQNVNTRLALEVLMLDYPIP
ncbi:MAG: DNA polymerase III subunit delta' [Chloroflexi bacterium]|nr:DNA polymerase III subunit delta' [Chloroflexota bacterium]